jgi:hypothetical protein
VLTRSLKKRRYPYYTSAEGCSFSPSTSWAVVSGDEAPKRSWAEASTARRRCWSSLWSPQKMSHGRCRLLLHHHHLLHYHGGRLLLLHHHCRLLLRQGCSSSRAMIWSVASADEVPGGSWMAEPADGPTLEPSWQPGEASLARPRYWCCPWSAQKMSHGCCLVLHHRLLRHRRRTQGWNRC